MRYLLNAMHAIENRALGNELPPPVRPIETSPPLRLRDCGYWRDVVELLDELGDTEHSMQGQRTCRAVMLACDRLAWIEASRTIGS